MNLIESNIEIEYKYLAKMSKKDFHYHLSKILGRVDEPRYICSCDDYYKGHIPGSFIRYRKSSNITELTLKIKKMENVIRKEVNLNMTGNLDSSITEFLELSGYKKEFSVFKESWVWKINGIYEDGRDYHSEISYYTLSDDRSYIEIEVDLKNHTNQEDGLKILNYLVDKLNFSQLPLIKESRSLFEILSDEYN